MMHYDLYFRGLLLSPILVGDRPSSAEAAEAAWRLGKPLVEGSALDNNRLLVLRTGEIRQTDARVDDVIGHSSYWLCGNPEYSNFALVLTREVEAGTPFILVGHDVNGHIRFKLLFNAECSVSVGQPLHVRRAQVLFKSDTQFLASMWWSP